MVVIKVAARREDERILVIGDFRGFLGTDDRQVSLACGEAFMVEKLVPDGLDGDRARSPRSQSVITHPP